MQLPMAQVEERSSLRALIVECAPILFLFAAFSRVVPRGIVVPPETFTGPSIIGRALLEPKFFVFVLLPALLTFVFWSRLRWQNIRGAQNGMRQFISALCVASAFTFATYDYNLYLDQSHLVDRLLILGVAVGAWWHPAFAALYAAMGMIVVQQFEIPTGLFDWLDKRILFVVLHLLTAFLAMAVIRRQRAVIFAGLAASVLAAN